MIPTFFYLQPCTVCINLKMNDADFKLSLRASRFLTYVANWKCTDFTETRGNP